MPETTDQSVSASATVHTSPFWAHGVWFTRFAHVPVQTPVDVVTSITVVVPCGAFTARSSRICGRYAEPRLAPEMSERSPATGSWSNSTISAISLVPPFCARSTQESVPPISLLAAQGERKYAPPVTTRFCWQMTSGRPGRIAPCRSPRTPFTTNRLVALAGVT